MQLLPPRNNVNVVVHGDDFVSEARKKDLLWFDDEPKKHFELKTETLGPSPDDVKELRIINRVLR